MSNRILIVDDSRTSRMFIQQALEIAGLTGGTFVGASNGIEALEILRGQEAFHMMVTDINMPGKSGMELIREIRESGLSEALKIFVISSTQCPMRDATLKELGVFAILEKPINMQKIMSTFASLPKDA